MDAFFTIVGIYAFWVWISKSFDNECPHCGLTPYDDEDYDHEDQMSQDVPRSAVKADPVEITR